MSAPEEKKPEEKKPEETPAPAPEMPAPKEATKVDTGMLQTAGVVELKSELITADDLGVLTAAEKARLDMLFQ